MAHKKGVGSSRNGRDSNPQYRGIKKFGGEKVIAGNIIVRQCGTKWHPGRNVGLGTDYTIYSLIDGVVKFEHKSKTRYKVSVYPAATDEPTRGVMRPRSSKKAPLRRGPFFLHSRPARRRTGSGAQESRATHRRDLRSLTVTSFTRDDDGHYSTD